MTLKGHWDILTERHKSPQLFLDFSLYWMIGAALQRRVWLHSHHKPIIPSLYVFLVGGPGVGKGIIVDDISAFMSYHKFRPRNAAQPNELEKRIAKLEAEGASPEVLSMLRQAREAMSDVKDAGEKKIRAEDLLLFPCSADSTTYESLVQQHAQSVRTYHVGAPCPMAPSGIYTYHSMNIIIEEASSMFHDRANRIAQYLLKVYNGQDYKYKTKHQGEDTIRKCSLSLLAGTTPEFMRQIFGAEILGDGFAARTFFIYGKEARFEEWRFQPESLEQQSSRNAILKRLKDLSNLFGEVKMTPEAEMWMDFHYKGKDMNIKKNADPKLAYYYARHNLHIQKLALCMHFADSDDMTIKLESFEKAQRLLAKAEETMHLCLNITGRNPIGALQRNILKWMVGQEKEIEFVDIYKEFIDEATDDELQSAMDFLVFANKVKQDGMKYKAIV